MLGSELQKSMYWINRFCLIEGTFIELAECQSLNSQECLQANCSPICWIFIFEISRCVSTPWCLKAAVVVGVMHSEAWGTFRPWWPPVCWARSSWVRGELSPCWASSPPPPTPNHQCGRGGAESLGTGKCLLVYQLPDSGLQSSTDRDDLNLKAGICAFSAVLGKMEKFFCFVLFFSECKCQRRKWSENYTKQSLPSDTARHLLCPPQDI